MANENGLITQVDSPPSTGLFLSDNPATGEIVYSDTNAGTLNLIPNVTRVSADVNLVNRILTAQNLVVISPKPPAFMNLQSEDYLLQSRSFQEQLDIVVKSILNLATSAVPRPACLAAIVDIINDLRAMDTELWGVINPAASVTFPTYTTAEVLSRGPFLSNTNNAQALLLLATLTPVVTNIKAVYIAQTASPLISSEDITSDNIIFYSGANTNYQTAYTDLMAKLTTVITDIPLLTGI